MNRCLWMSGIGWISDRNRFHLVFSVQMSSIAYIHFCCLDLEQYHHFRYCLLYFVFRVSMGTMHNQFYSKSWIEFSARVHAFQMEPQWQLQRAYFYGTIRVLDIPSSYASDPSRRWAHKSNWPNPLNLHRHLVYRSFLIHFWVVSSIIIHGSIGFPSLIPNFSYFQAIFPRLIFPQSFLCFDFWRAWLFPNFEILAETVMSCTSDTDSVIFYPGCPCKNCHFSYLFFQGRNSYSYMVAWVQFSISSGQHSLCF